MRNGDQLLLQATKAASAEGFIDTELRGAAMKLHTRSQAPKEGEAENEIGPEKKLTHANYLQFLVDSKHIYEEFEEVVARTPALDMFRDTGLERTKPLEIDIKYLVEEYDLIQPPTTEVGLKYAEEIRRLIEDDSIPQFICHYYNFYFAHTAGGRAIGKNISEVLLNKEVLKFYKWENLNKIKADVKSDIEALVASWTREEKDACVSETESAFAFGGAVNRIIF